MKELLSKYKVTLSIGGIAGLVAFGYLANNYLEKNLFDPIESIDKKLDRSEYENDKRERYLRDSLRRAIKEALGKENLRAKNDTTYGDN